MELPGFALDGPMTCTPYADVAAGRWLYDGTAVRVERLRAADPAVAARLRAAADALRRADGRHLVRVRQVLAEPPVLVREDVAGQDLGVIEDLTPDAAVQVVADVLDALDRLHALGLVHGALRPADVLLDTTMLLRRTVRLTGWGLAALVLPVSPTPADDVRDAGRLLADLVTGGGSGPLPPELAPVLGPMLADDPAERPTAAQARDALRQVQGLPPAPFPVRVQQPAPAAPPRPARVPAPPEAPAPARPRDPRRPLLLAGAGVLGLLVLGLGVLAGRLLSGDDPAGLPRVQPTSAVPAGPYVFAALQRADGLVLERTWVLEEEGAVLRGTTVLRNPTLSARSAGVDEVVPKSVADDVDDLAFTPGPDAIIERDPIVRFNVAGLAPGSSTTWTFVVRLPQAVQKEALPGLAADAEAARVDYEQRLAVLRGGPSASPAPGAPGPSPTS